MSERKVLTKYYPPDFDPSKIGRTPKHLRPTGPKTISVRLMAPYSMKYPKNMDYTSERGAKRNFEPWRDPASKELQETDEQRLDRLEREEAEAAEEEERNAMEELEAKMEESKREMQVADALDEIRTRNARIERGGKGGKEDQALAQARLESNESRLREEQELEEAARLVFAKDNVERARLEEEQELDSVADRETESKPATYSFEKEPRPRKVNNSTILLKKAISNTTKPPAAAAVPVVASGLGLAGYDSDEED
ncbi:Pre-mRNA-splicing factor cwf16 [Lithohypha guttulata]|uniref:Pre-mRNA-splicing factor cwf16 n=1 Tax=Lithohypha guttulata TaxID=1690604 RepID=A0AAN7T532_9EURO|nr:Pre-mRNA-splicing factor cwf16 [Lithohypha guttulata]KAK5088324.1 Pre-mRNA-splicing factor cwf16 [Lithohypha guttulata]